MQRYACTLHHLPLPQLPPHALLHQSVKGAARVAGALLQLHIVTVAHYYSCTLLQLHIITVAPQRHLRESHVVCLLHQLLQVGGEVADGAAQEGQACAAAVKAKACHTLHVTRDA